MNRIRLTGHYTTNEMWIWPLDHKEKTYEHYLVASARLGDQRSFEALVRFRGPRLLSHAYRLLGNRDEALDAVQEAWLEITRNLKTLREPGAFATWAYRIVTRRCAKTIDRNVKDRLIVQTHPASEIDNGVDSGEVHILRAAIDRLSPEHAATIRLFYLEEFSAREVAQAMDVPVGTVKSRLKYAREKLNNHLKGNQND